jgi:hypothetical protein
MWYPESNGIMGVHCWDGVDSNPFQWPVADDSNALLIRIGKPYLWNNTRLASRKSCVRGMWKGGGVFVTDTGLRGDLYPERETARIFHHRRVD